MKNVKTMYMVIHKIDDGMFYDRYVNYMDYDIADCLEFVVDMIKNGEYKKGDWDIVSCDIDRDTISQILEGFDN